MRKKGRREKILVIALPGIGDGLLSTPMIEILRRERPDAEIHALVMFAATREMFEHDPCIDKVHFYDFISDSKVGALKLLYKLRSEIFDISINIYPQNRREYNGIALAIGARIRLGVRYRRLDSENLNWLNTHTITENDRLHCVQENVKLLKLIGHSVDLSEKALPVLRLAIGEKHDRFAAEWYAQSGIAPSDLTIGFHAGTALFKNHIRRRWSPEKFGELAINLHTTLGAKVLLFGGPDDREANAEILRIAGNSIIEVKTKSIMDSVAVMKRLSMFVSNDSALMHIAGALALPTVAIFGPTNEAYVHPWKTRYVLVQTGIECRPCFVYSPKPLTCYRTDPAEAFLCIRAIEVDQVVSAVKQLLPVRISM